MQTTPEPVELSQDDIIRHQQGSHRKQLLRVGLTSAGIILVIALSLLFLNRSSDPDLPQEEHSQPLVEKILETDALREQFKQILSGFEQQIQPVLSNESLRAWAPEEVLQLEQSKAQAINAFAKGTYSTGVSLLTQVGEQSLALKQKWDQAFEQKLDRAALAFVADEINPATLALNQAFKIKPQDPEAQSLAQQLAVYPMVAELLSKLAVAQSEQDPIRQIQVMEQVLALDPHQTEIGAELEKLKQQQQQKAFSRLIEQALAALDAGQITAATKFYQQANGTGLESDGLSAIAQSLKKQRRQLSQQATRQQLNQLAKADQWSVVLNRLRSARKRFPADKEFIQLEKSGREILRLKSKANGYLARPDRLQDDNIARFARTMISQAAPLVAQSPSLAIKIEQVASKLVAANRNVSLLIQSDEETFIRVLGLGTVGEIENKTLQLPPGNYVLEGSRKGYRNKQVSVVLKAGQGPVTVSLVCDERI